MKGHLANEKMLVKFIKDHPFVVGDYAQWFMRNPGRKEAMDAKVIATKLKDKVY